MDELIVKAFRAWQKRNLRPGAAVDHEHVLAFFMGLADDGEQLEFGSWELVHGALRKAGIVPAAERHIWIGTRSLRPRLG